MIIVFDRLVSKCCHADLIKKEAHGITIYLCNKCEKKTDPFAIFSKRFLQHEEISKRH